MIGKGPVGGLRWPRVAPCDPRGASTLLRSQREQVSDIQLPQAAYRLLDDYWKAGSQAARAWAGIPLSDGVSQPYHHLLLHDYYSLHAGSGRLQPHTASAAYWAGIRGYGIW